METDVHTAARALHDDGKHERGAAQLLHTVVAVLVCRQTPS